MTVLLVDAVLDGLALVIDFDWLDHMRASCATHGNFRSITIFDFDPVRSPRWSLDLAAIYTVSNRSTGRNRSIKLIVDASRPDGARTTNTSYLVRIRDWPQSTIGIYI